MLKILTICAFLCTVPILRVQTLKKAVLTENLKFKSRNPFVVENHGHLYGLINKNETHVQTYAFDNDIEPCSYDLETSVLNDIRPSILHAVHLGAEPVVTGLSVRIQSTEDGFRETIYDLIWFDLEDCKKTIFKKILTESVPDSYPDYRSQLVVYQKTFDLFSIGNSTCSPCRFNKLGIMVPLNDQLEHEKGRHFKSFHVLSVQPKILDQFLYTYSFDNGTSVIKLLTPYYRLIRQRYVDDPVIAIVVNNGYGALFGICYETSNTSSIQKVSCDRLDINLKTVQTFHLPIPENHFVVNLTISLDAVGNTYVGVIQESLNDRRHSKWLVLFHYDKHGKLREALDFGDIGRRQGHYEPDVFTKLESYLFRDQYCMVVYEEFGYYALNHRLHIRCIKVPTNDKK